MYIYNISYTYLQNKIKKHCIRIIYIHSSTCLCCLLPHLSIMDHIGLQPRKRNAKIRENSVHLRISCSSLPKSCKDPVELSSSLPDSLARLWLEALLLEVEFRVSSAISPVVNHPAHAGRKGSQKSSSPKAGFSFFSEPGSAVFETQGL